MGRGAGEELLQAPATARRGRAASAASVASAASATPTSARREPLDKLSQTIRSVLTDDLLKPQYRGAERPYTGHCYVASEALYHLRGGPSSGLRPTRVRHEGSVHWWLQDDEGRIYDLTAEQFATPVPYDQGKGGGFLTRDPSARAQEVISRLPEDLRGGA